MVAFYALEVDLLSHLQKSATLCVHSRAEPCAGGTNVSRKNLSNAPTRCHTISGGPRNILAQLTLLLLRWKARFCVFGYFDFNLLRPSSIGGYQTDLRMAILSAIYLRVKPQQQIIPSRVRNDVA